MKKIGFILLSFASFTASSASLDEISNFAEKICDTISTKGTISSSELKAEIEGKISPKVLSKMLGANVRANGSYLHNGKEYDGLPYESLPEQMTSARECRKEVASMLIKERRNLQKSESLKAKYAIQNSGFHSMLMKEPKFNDYISFFKKTPSQIKILMDGTKVELLEEYTEQIKPNPIPWYKIKVISGPDEGLTGWIPYRSVKAL